ncbi:hypothetical protein M3Y97_00145300 [Aphelenchoides bicaudatus]|nr:hypothetical protein M3Y97_00145300 [Aphelenchoides bicaudatus]
MPRKEKLLRPSLRRKLDDESMSIMNESLIDNNNPNISSLDASATDLNGSTKDISLLQGPESMIVPKMNMNAKSPADVFKLEDFFEEGELPVFVMCGKNFFSAHSTLEKLCELGAPKFVALRIIEAWRRGDLFAAASLKLLVLSLLYPRGRSFTTHVPISVLNNIAHQVVTLIEPAFLHGKTNREKKFVVEKRYKEKMFFHMIGLYFAMAGPGSYNLPLSTLATELQIGDNVAKPLLQNIGCAVQTATPDEQKSYGTVLMARFIGPVRTVIRKGGRGRGRIR